MSKKQQQSSSVGVFLVILLALGFLGFLFYLATVPVSDGSSSIKQDVQRAVQKGTEKIQEADQKAPKASYDFYKLLENQTVEVSKVDEYKSTPKDANLSYQYLLQVASFRTQGDADSLRASLLLDGLTAYTTKVEGSNGTWYRVMVGPFDNRSKMNSAQDKLVARNLAPMEFKQEKSN